MKTYKLIVSEIKCYEFEVTAENETIAKEIALETYADRPASSSLVEDINVLNPDDTLIDSVKDNSVEDKIEKNILEYEFISY